MLWWVIDDVVEGRELAVVTVAPVEDGYRGARYRIRHHLLAVASEALPAASDDHHRFAV